jgi:hypothetical protein
MRFERGFAVVTAVAITIGIGLTRPSVSEAQVLADSRRTTFGLMVGWNIPAGGFFDEHWNTGFALSGSAKRLWTDNLLGGFEFGYSWHGLDTESFQQQYPQYGVTGGDLSVMPLVAVADYFFGSSSATVRPFVTGGLGAYFLFTNNIQLSGPTSIGLNTYSDSTNFGAFAGGGIFIRRSDTWGVRVDASYASVFGDGEDVAYVPIRVGIHWTPVF